MSRNSWWASVVKGFPLRWFFWAPTGVVSDSPQWLSNQSALQPVTRYQELRPGATLPGADHTCYFSELPEARVVGDASLVATRADFALGNLQGLHGTPRPAEAWLVKRRRFRVPKRMHGTALLLAAAPGANYFHWLFDSLPRLRLAELAGVDLDDVDHILLNQRSTAFHHESLDRLGVPREKRYRCLKGELLVVERLLLPSPPAATGACPPWVCEFLRQRFLTSRLPPASRRIYITRRQARGRRFIGEEQHEPWLRQRGFEIVSLEKVSFAAQVELFASARLVAGVHGAGMSNLVFSQPGCRVLEIFPAAYRQHSYRNLSATMGLDYHSLVGAPSTERVKAAGLANVYLDPAEFRRHVDAALFDLDAPRPAPVS